MITAETIGAWRALSYLLPEVEVLDEVASLPPVAWPREPVFWKMLGVEVE